MKSTRVRTSAHSSSSPSTGKSELQRKLQSMVIACREKDVVSAGAGKLTHNELRMKRAEAQMNFAKTSPAALVTLPIESIGSNKSNLDPLQNCYGRAAITNPSTNGPKGILSNPTSKISKGKRVTWNIDLESDIPSRPDSPYTPDPANSVVISNSLPNVEQKSTNSTAKKPLFQIPKPTRPSLSEQLSMIANRASDITADIKAKAGIVDNSSGTSDQPIFTSPAKNFTVGNLQCRWISFLFRTYMS